MHANTQESLGIAFTGDTCQIYMYVCRDGGGEVNTWGAMHEDVAKVAKKLKK
jgi:hypothetical protein